MVQQGQGKNDRLDQINWDARIVTDTTYCDFQVKGDNGDTLDWHTSLDMHII